MIIYTNTNKEDSMKRRKRIALVWADPFNGNRGVGALAYSALYILTELAERMKLKLEIVILGTKTGKYNIVINNKMISFIGMAPLISFKNTCTMIIHPKEFINYLKFDYVFDIGAGDSYSDIYGKTRFYQLNFSKKFFRFLFIKQLLLPQTIGPFNDLSVKRTAIKSLNKCSLVLTRDKQSYNYTKSISNQKNLFEVIDMAFFMPYEMKSFDTKMVNVGIGISALLWNGGYTGKNEFGLKTNYQECIHLIINLFLSKKDTMVHLVPHVVVGDHNIENDYAVSVSLEKEFSNKRLLISPFFITPIEAKNYISGLDFFAGARMHACIAAFSSFVPVFPMGYSRKFNGLFADTLEYPYIGDMLKEDSTQILWKLGEAFDKRENLKATITERMNTTIKERYKLLNSQLEVFLNC